MRTAYLDCFAGISGDMFLGALLDAGVPAAVLNDAVNALGLDASLRVEKVNRSGISATKVHVLEGGRLAEASLVPSHAGEHAHAHGHTHTHQHADTHQHTHPNAQSDTDLGTTQPAHTHSHPDGDSAHHHHQADQPHQHGRSLTQIRELIRASALPDPVKDFATRTFALLGASEAKIHGVPVDEIHFHEVGAVDAIVDIVAAAAGIVYLRQPGPLDWYCSNINVGGGMVECAHGTFPVPAPATADLLRGLPTYSAHVQKELVTPTGAALLRALSPSFAPQPSMRVHALGYGAGTRNPHGFPNVLRLSVGERESAGNHTAPVGHEGDPVAVLEAALDDATPQLLAYVAERSLAAGALDVMLMPVIMKKGRPGTLITVLCEPDQSQSFADLLLRETTTLGVRLHQEQRVCLARRHVSVVTEYGDIRIKLGARDGDELNAMPEYEDCRAAALRHNAPLKQVLQAAVAAHAAAPVAR